MIRFQHVIIPAILNLIVVITVTILQRDTVQWTLYGVRPAPGQRPVELLQRLPGL